jgi:hypothetical protein
VFGNDPLAGGVKSDAEDDEKTRGSKVAPYVMIAAGASQWSAKVGVQVWQPVAGGSGSAPVLAIADAWRVGGPGFASLGGGIRWAIVPRLALTFGPRVNVAFGNDSPLFSISPELGVAYGI